MPNAVGFVDDTSVLAHYALLAEIKTLIEANDWTTLRYDTSTANHELIMQAPGLSGTEEIFVGIRTYQDVSSDYYNLLLGGFTGYVSGNSFDTQPGAFLTGLPAHNQRIDYWLTMNGQRLAMALKVGTPVYESGYIGKFLPYGTPSQYPYPLVVGGALTGAATTRFSDTVHDMPYRGNNARMGVRFVSGSYVNAYCYPWGNTSIMAGGASNFSIRPATSQYDLIPAVLHDNTANVFGELDGIFAITGFNNAVENTLTIDDIDYVVFQAVGRTGFADYYAMRLDA